MFDIGWSELFVIAVVAIVVVGPKELPALLRTLGRYVGKMKQTANEFRGHFDEAIREAELETMRTEIESVRKIDPVGSIRRSIEQPMEKKEGSAGPSAADDPATLGQPSVAPAGAPDEPKP